MPAIACFKCKHNTVIVMITYTTIDGGLVFRPIVPVICMVINFLPTSGMMAKNLSL